MTTDDKTPQDSRLNLTDLLDGLDLAAEFEALREYHNAVRGWNTAGLDISWWDGWYVYAGPYPIPLRPNGTAGGGDEKAQPFRSVVECLHALRRYVESNDDRMRSI